MLGRDGKSTKERLRARDYVLGVTCSCEMENCLVYASYRAFVSFALKDFFIRNTVLSYLFVKGVDEESRDETHPPESWRLLEANGGTV